MPMAWKMGLSSGMVDGSEEARRVNVNTTDATAGATALLLPAQNTRVT